MPLPSILDRRVSARLTDALLSLQPTALWPLDDGNGPLRDLTGRWPATVTGTPTFGVALPSPVDRGMTWPGSGSYATASTSFPVPAASVSVGCLFASTDATGTRAMVGRAAAGTASFELDFTSAGAVRFLAFQAGGASHATASLAGTANDGILRLAVGTFDGTTIIVHAASATGSFGAAQSASLTGSWALGTSMAVTIASRLTTTNPYIGSLARPFVINDRVLTAADVRWLASIVFGG